MLNLEFIQKLVFKTGEVSKHGLLLEIPSLIMHLMILMSIYYILLGEKKERLMGFVIIIALGFFYVGSETLQLAYGVEAVTNAFYTPIIKVSLPLATIFLYGLFTLLCISGFRKLQKHSQNKSS